MGSIGSHLAPPGSRASWPQGSAPSMSGSLMGGRSPQRSRCQCWVLGPRKLSCPLACRRASGAGRGGVAP
eukprot:5852835-Lingulodinium_polyedra.AAC.1